MKFKVTISQVSRNISSSVAYTVMSGITLFFLYKHMLLVLGPEKIGIWSVVIATTSVGKLTELGFTSALTRFVAVDHARGSFSRAAHIVETGIVSVAVALAMGLLVLEPLLVSLLTHVVKNVEIQEAVKLLHYAMASMWISTISSLIMSGLDGCQRIDLRSYINMFGMLIYFSIAYQMVEPFGVIGLALAQIIQAVVVVIVGWTLLKKQLVSLSLFPRRWSRSLFNEIWSYGYKVQFNSVLSIFVEPAAKMMLAKFGGMSSAGYFEMANRLMSQFRTLIASANQVLAPMAAARESSGPEEWHNTCATAMNMAIAFSTPVGFGLVTTTPLISMLWLGHYDETFVLYLGYLSMSLLLSIAAIPAFFIHLGAGRIRLVIIANVITGLTTVGLGAILGSYLKGQGVVLAYGLAIIAGNMSLIMGRHVMGGSLRTISRENWILWLSAIIMSGATLTTMMLPATFFVNMKAYSLVAPLSCLVMAILIAKNKTYHSLMIKVMGKFLHADRKAAS